MREIAVVVSNHNERVTPFETIEAIKDAGFKNVFIQWYNKEWECSQEDQLKYIKKLGLNVILAHLGYQNINAIWEEGEIGDRLTDRFINDIKVCKENGIDMVIMHVTTKFIAPMHNEIGLNRIKKIVDYAKKLGVKVAFENLKIKGYIDYIIKNIDNDNVGICYDAGHCHAHFKDEFNWGLFKNRIFAIHLHDNDGTDDQHLLPFDGNINWENVIKELKEANYNGPVTLEVCYREDYLSMNVEDFYKKAYKLANKLLQMFEGEV